MKFKSRGDKVFDIFNIILMGLLLLIFIYPFLDILWLSLASPKDVYSMRFRILPKFPISFEAYRIILSRPVVYTAFLNSIIRTSAGAALTTLVTFMGAFVLAKRTLPLRKTLTLFVMFTFFFSGGLIPSFLLLQDLGLMHTRWALILPSLTSAWYLMIARNFIMTIPSSLEEAAWADGAGIITMMFRIFAPMCLPIIIG